MKDKKNVYLILILLFAFIIRLIPLFKQELWIDEAYCIYAIKFYKFPFYDPTNPPFYFLLLKIWSLVSSHYFWLRLFSLLVAILNIYFFYLLGKILLNQNFGLLSAFILSSSSFHIHYSWQTRMYALYMLLVNISLFMLLIFLKILKEKKSPKAKFLFLFFLVNLIGTLTHYGFLLYLICLSLFLFIFIIKESLSVSFKKQKLLIIFLLCHSIIAILVFLLLNNKSGDIISTIKWIRLLNLKQGLFIFLSLNNGYIDVSGYVSKNILSFIPLLIILGTLFIYGLLKLKKINVFLYCLSLIIIILPFVLAFIFQKIFSVSIAISRTLSFIHIINQLILSLAFYYSRPKKQKINIGNIIILSLFVSLFLVAIKSTLTVVSSSLYIDKSYKTAVYSIKNKLKKNDQLIILPTYFQPLFWYHWGELKNKNEALFELTKKVEERLYDKNFNWSAIIKLNNKRKNLFIIVSYQSLLTKNENQLIEGLSNYCSFRTINKTTKIIYCSEGNLRKF